MPSANYTGSSCFTEHKIYFKTVAGPQRQREINESRALNLTCQDQRVQQHRVGVETSFFQILQIYGMTNTTADHLLHDGSNLLFSVHSCRKVSLFFKVPVHEFKSCILHCFIPNVFSSLIVIDCKFLGQSCQTH